MSIQWFPGHMAKAKREAQEKLKLIDVVIEIVDARIPLSSRNPVIDELAKGKPRLILLNKFDLADANITEKWLTYFKELDFSVLKVDAQKGVGIKQIPAEVTKLAKPMTDKMRAKGMNPRAIRALILGIPNVGKSTIINKLANKKIAKIGDKPGITKRQQWIKVGKELELLDTPGILWPKFEDQEVGLKLATTGAIKDTILNLQDVAVYALRFLEDNYPDNLKDRFGLDEIPEDIALLFDEIAKRRGSMMSGGYADYDKTAEIIIREIRTEKLGRLTFERP